MTITQIIRQGWSDLGDVDEDVDDPEESGQEESGLGWGVGADSADVDDWLDSDEDWD